MLVATFSVWRDGRRTSLSGQFWPLLRFLRSRAARVSLVDNPIGESDNRRPQIEVAGKDARPCVRRLPLAFSPLWYVQEAQRRENLSPLHLKLRDLVADLYFGMREEETVDLYVGVDPINALAGLILRSLGRVRQVVFYETDYVVQRYSNRLLNRSYLALDAYVARHADYVWNVTPAMTAARTRAGYPPEQLAQQVMVPVGTFPEQIHALPYDHLTPGHIVYAGGFSEQNGVWSLLKAATEVCRRVPLARFTILGWGGSSIEAAMRRFIAEHSLQDRVKMPGFFSDHRAVEAIISQSWLGVAPFKDLAYSIKRNGDVSKLRMYLSCGVPVITTDVTYLAGEIARRGAGVVIKDDERRLAEAIITLIEDRAKHRQYRAAALDMARHNTWDAVFSKAFAEIGFL